MSNSKEFVEYFVPGSRVWIRVEDPTAADGEGNPLFVKTYGSQKELVYVGYQHMATATYLVFDRFDGVGRRTLLERFSINSNKILYLGVIEEKEQPPA